MSFLIHDRIQFSTSTRTWSYPACHGCIGSTRQTWDQEKLWRWWRGWSRRPGRRPFISHAFSSNIDECTTSKEYKFITDEERWIWLWVWVWYVAQLLVSACYELYTLHTKRQTVNVQYVQQSALCIDETWNDIMRWSSKSNHKNNGPNVNLLRMVLP